MIPVGSAASADAQPRAPASPPDPPLDTAVWTDTPERVRLAHFVAGPARRYLAYLLDLLLRVALLALSAAALSLAGAGSELGEGVGRGALLLLLFALEWSYYVLFETLWNGRTPGKRALGLRVIKDGGFPIGFTDSVLRNLLRAADFLPAGYALGAFVMGGDTRFRRLGDRVAGTLVVCDEAVALPPPLVLQPPLSAAELAALPGRPSLRPGELEAIDLLLRRDGLSPARRDELGALLAPVLAARLGLSGLAPTRMLALVHRRAQRDAASPPMAAPTTPAG